MMISSYLGAENADELEVILRRVQIGLTALQQFQELYDSALWAIQEPPFAKFRHIAIHISIVAGELAKLCEQWEHLSTAQEDGSNNIDVSSRKDEIKSLTADLLIHASQLSNLIAEDLNSNLINRVVENACRFAPESRLANLSLTDSQ